jgi:hypothetical protein
LFFTKIKMSKLKPVPHHEALWQSGCITPCILNLVSGRNWVYASYITFCAIWHTVRLVYQSCLVNAKKSLVYEFMRNIWRFIYIPEWRFDVIITVGPLYFQGKHPSAPKGRNRPKLAEVFLADAVPCQSSELDGDCVLCHGGIWYMVNRAGEALQRFWLRLTSQQYYPLNYVMFCIMLVNQ